MEASTDTLAAELEQSRSDILQLADRVRMLIVKRGKREALLQRLHRTAASPQALSRAVAPHYLCSLCANDYASLAIEHVRGCPPNLRCDQCGQPAIIWIQLKEEPQREMPPSFAAIRA